MLFHPDFGDSSSSSCFDVNIAHENNVKNNSKKSENNNNELRSSFGRVEMFSATSPSPTRTMIKEANDHLQLLHHRVVELERTVQEQAEALIKKDEAMQTKMRELTEAKDSKISEVAREMHACEMRIKKLEQQVRDKDAHVEYLMQKYGLVDELSAYAPMLDRLLTTLKKLPRNVANNNSASAAAAAVVASSHVIRPAKHSRNATRVKGGGGGNVRNATVVATPTSANVDQMGAAGTAGAAGAAPPSQAMADLRLSRSFSINQNFSMSEDEAEEYS